MLDIAVEPHRWAEEGRDFAVATVVSGTAVDSVSGGRAEGAVYDLCVQAFQDDRVVRERFGYSDEDAFAVGLTCGNHEFPMQISPESHA